MNTDSFLTHLEKVLKTDLRYLLHGSFWLSTAKIFTAISSFVVAVAFANLLPQESYGQYKYLISILGLLTATSLLGLGESLVISVAKGFEGAYKKAFFVSVKWSTVGSGISFITSCYYLLAGDNLLGYALLVIAVALPVYSPPQILKSILHGRKEYKKISKFHIIEAIFCSLAIFVSLLLTKNVLFVFTIYVMSHVLIRSLVSVLIVKKSKPNQLLELNTISYGKHLSLIRLLAHAGNHLDKILIWHFIGAASLAVYSMAIVMPDQLRSILKTLQPLALPKFAKSSSETIKKTLPRKVTILFTLIIPLVLIYILIAPFLFNFFFSKYTDAILFSQIFSLLLLFYPLNFYYQAILSKVKKRQLYLIANSTQAIKIVLLFSLLPFLGLWAIIVTEFLTLLYNSIVVLFFFKKL